MTTTPPQRQQRTTDDPARLAAGPHRAAQRAGSRRDRPNRARQALSSPVIALTAPLGSSPADLTSPSAKPARTVKASPTGPSAAGRAAVALTDRARVANHATNPALPSNHYPMTTPGTGCELHAQISEKDSDTRQHEALGWEEVSTVKDLQAVQAVVDRDSRKRARSVRPMAVGPLALNGR